MRSFSRSRRTGVFSSPSLRDGQPGVRRVQVALALLTLAVLLLGQAYGVAPSRGASPLTTTAVVGRQADGSILTPTDQFITPAGRQVSFPGRPIAEALSPDGKTAVFLVQRASAGNGSVTNGSTVTTNTYGILVAVDLATGAIKQYAETSGDASFNGITYAPDGSRLYWSQGGGSIGVEGVDSTGALTSSGVITLPAPSGNPNPGGLAVSADGSRLYVAINQYNTLGVIDTASRSLLQQIPVGNAPDAVIVTGTVAYVSNNGGRTAQQGDVTNMSSGTTMVANPYDGSASTGTVSVVDLTGKIPTTSIAVGLHPTALHLATFACGTYLFVANTYGDSISVVDTSTDQVVNTIKITPFPKAPYGSSPTGLSVVGGNRLAVTLGRNNAVAIYDLNTSDMSQPATLEGLAPTGSYPAAVAVDTVRNSLVIANDRGVGSLQVTDQQSAAMGATTPKAVQENEGTVSLIPVPTSAQMAMSTTQVSKNNGWDTIDATAADPGAAPAAVPLHVGEPSPIKHVFYIIKENRTYDQVLGDVTAGNGNGNVNYLMFGQSVTPNEHSMVQMFPLFDNYYDSGALSADGHQWVVQANGPDYIEKAFGNFTRSYPDDGFDALDYLPNSFIWENALQHSKTIADFGEYTNEFNNITGTIPTFSDVPSLDPYVKRDFPSFDTSVPDQHRADIFQRYFNGYVKNGDLPNFTMMWLCNDHTGGSSPQYPTPQSMVADNDLALGRMVDMISHSSYWASSAIFVTEDDAQAGLDHVDGHRTTAYILSPYAKHGTLVSPGTPAAAPVYSTSVDHTYYTQVNMVRTMEQILGLPPMNQMDAAAQPMRDAFTNTPDLTPYTVVTNTMGAGTPGQGMNPALASLGGLQREWAAASMTQDLRHADAADRRIINRADWYAVKGYHTPYPGDKRVLHPYEVPGFGTWKPTARGDGSIAAAVAVDRALGLRVPAALMVHTFVHPGGRTSATLARYAWASLGRGSLPAQGASLFPGSFAGASRAVGRALARGVVGASPAGPATTRAHRAQRLVTLTSACVTSGGTATPVPAAATTMTATAVATTTTTALATLPASIATVTAAVPAANTATATVAAPTGTSSAPTPVPATVTPSTLPAVTATSVLPGTATATVAVLTVASPTATAAAAIGTTPTAAPRAATTVPAPPTATPYPTLGPLPVAPAPERCALTNLFLFPRRVPRPRPVAIVEDLRPVANGRTTSRTALFFDDAHGVSFYSHTKYDNVRCNVRGFEVRGTVLRGTIPRGTKRHPHALLDLHNMVFVLTVTPLRVQNHMLYNWRLRLPARHYDRSFMHTRGLVQTVSIR